METRECQMCGQFKALEDFPSVGELKEFCLECLGVIDEPDPEEDEAPGVVHPPAVVKPRERPELTARYAEKRKAYAREWRKNHNNKTYMKTWKALHDYAAMPSLPEFLEEVDQMTSIVRMLRACRDRLNHVQKLPWRPRKSAWVVKVEEKKRLGKPLTARNEITLQNYKLEEELWMARMHEERNQLRAKMKEIRDRVKAQIEDAANNNNNNSEPNEELPE